MLPRHHRLSFRAGKAIFRHAHHMRLDPFLLRKAATMSPSSPTRFAFLISRKLYKKSSPTRARMLRQIRHATSQLLPRLRPGYACLLFLERPLDNLKGETLQERVRALLARAGLLHPHTP